MGFPREEDWSGLPFLLQGIFPTQGSIPGLPHRRQILYRWSHQGNPKLYKDDSVLIHFNISLLRSLLLFGCSGSLPRCVGSLLEHILLLPRSDLVVTPWPVEPEFPDQGLNA